MLLKQFCLNAFIKSVLCFLYCFIEYHHQNRMNIQYISPSPNWAHWLIVWAMSWSCMHISALYNSCDDAASCMMFYSFEISSSFTLLMGNKKCPPFSKLIFFWFIKAESTCVHSFCLSSSVSLYLHGVYLHGAVPLLCFDRTPLISNTQIHMSFFLGHTMFVSSHALVLYSALWRPCLVSSHPPLSFLSFSLPLFLSRSLALSLSTASSQEKASPLPEGRSRSLRSNRSYSGSSVAVVRMTPLSFIPGAKIIKYLGIINMFFIRETTSLREVAVSVFTTHFTRIEKFGYDVKDYYYYYYY